MDKLKNHTKLKALMVEHGKNQKDMANYLEISERALNSKINGDTDFKETEINKLLKLFNARYENLFLPYKLT